MLGHYTSKICLMVCGMLVNTAFCNIYTVTEENYQQYFKSTEGSIFLYVTKPEDCELCGLLYSKFVIASQIFVKYRDISFGHVNDGVLAEAFGITSFPGIVYYVGGGASPNIYTGDITPMEITKLVASTVNKDAKKVGVKFTVGITSSNFNDLMNTEKQHRLVLLHKHDDLVELDDFDEIAEAFQNEFSIVLGTINVDKQNRLRQMFLVNNYPALYWYPKGAVDHKKLYGGRLKVEAMVKFINDKCGFFRTNEGTLNNLAGLLEPLDRIVKEHANDLYKLTYLALLKVKLTKEIAKLPVDTDLELAEFYVHLISEVEEDKTFDAISETRNRIYRRMIGASPFELDQLHRKKNIANKIINTIGDHLNEIEGIKVKKNKGVKKLENEGADDHSIEFHDEF